MKKIFLSMATLALLFSSCDNEKSTITPSQDIDMSDFSVYTPEANLTAKPTDGKSNTKTCYSMNVLNRQLQENPGLEQKMYAIEYQTRKFIAAKGKPGGSGGGGGGNSDPDVDVLPIADNLGTINIPVYVHIVYPDASTVTDAQVNSQIATLNDDFVNPHTDQLPSGTNFANDATNAGFSFTVAGVFRHNDPTSSWGTNDAVKAAYPPISPATHLNIWVCNIGGGILGYAQFPGGAPETDGVVIGGPYFGTTSGVYGLGRTATHEIGHYLNLRHIWGDGPCRFDDYVADTPDASASNGGCPTFPSVSCKSADMTMNYMDYTYDDCMYMFTDGQRNRMRAIFQPGGARAALVGN